MGWAKVLGEESIELPDAALQLELKTTFGLTLKPSKLLKEIDLNDYAALLFPMAFSLQSFMWMP